MNLGLVKKGINGMFAPHLIMKKVRSVKIPVYIKQVIYCDAKALNEKVFL